MYLAFHLRHLNIKAVEKETYLGYIINTDMSDDDHISKEIKNIYARGNMLIPILSTARLVLRLPFLKHIVQAYIVARCGLIVIKVQLVK